MVPPLTRDPNYSVPADTGLESYLETLETPFFLVQKNMLKCNIRNSLIVADECDLCHMKQICTANPLIDL